MNLEGRNAEIIVLGGGLAGLSAGYVLARGNRDVLVLESSSTVGGLSKTVTRGEFRFDLGGHRFFTNNKQTECFVKDLMGEELLRVPRTSKIYLRNKYFDYPIKPANAIFGLGIPTTLKIIYSYGIEKVIKRLKNSEHVSLEDWVVGNFGRTMFDIYFKEYSEKVWGIDCNRISAEWVAKRIQGLSLGTAVKNAFFKFSGREIPTLADEFLYPALGIGRISDKLREGIEETGRVLTNTAVECLYHSNFRIEKLRAKSGSVSNLSRGHEFISSIPMTTLVGMLRPRAPQDVLDAAARLKYRDLVIVAIMVNRERVTDQSWIYIPEKRIPLGRIHEPKNWSSKMAPEGKSLLVTEHFCFEGDETWRASDEELAKSTTDDLERLGFVKRDEVIDHVVIRVPKAYPLLEVGYGEHYSKVVDYLNRFQNLHTIGRGGTFRYLNMDHAIETGLGMAEHIMGSPRKGFLCENKMDRMALAGEAR